MKTWIIVLLCAIGLAVVTGLATKGFGLMKASPLPAPQVPSTGVPPASQAFLDNDDMMSSSDGQMTPTPSVDTESRKRYPDPVPTNAPIAQQAIQAAAAIFWTVDLAQKHLMSVPSALMIADTQQTTVSLPWTLIQDASLLRADVSSLLTSYANHPLLRSYVLNALIQLGVAVELVDFMSLVSTNGVLTVDLTITPNTIRILPTSTRFLVKGDVQPMIDAIVDENGQSFGYVWDTMDVEQDTVGVLSNNDMRFRLAAKLQPDSKLTIGDLRTKLYGRGLTNPYILDCLSMKRVSVPSDTQPQVDTTIYIMLDTLNNRAVQLDNINNDDVALLTDKHTAEEAADKALVATPGWSYNVYSVKASLGDGGFSASQDAAPDGANWQVSVTTFREKSSCDQGGYDRGRTCDVPARGGRRKFDKRITRSCKAYNGSTRCPENYRKTGIACGVVGGCVRDCDPGDRDDGTACWEKYYAAHTYSKGPDKVKLMVSFSPSGVSDGSTLKHFQLQVDGRANLENALTHVDNRLPYDIRVWFTGPDGRGFNSTVSANQHIRIVMKKRPVDNLVSSSIDQRNSL